MAYVVHSCCQWPDCSPQVRFCRQWPGTCCLSDRQLGTNVRQDDGSLMRWILILKNILTASSAGHVYLRAANGQRCAANVR